MINKKKTLKKNPKVLHSDIHTDRPSDEAGPRVAFAPKKTLKII